MADKALLVRLGLVADEFKRGINEANRSLDTIKGSVSQVNAAFDSLKNIAAVSIAGISFAAVIRQASELEQTTFRLSRTFGDMADSMMSKAKALSEATKMYFSDEEFADIFSKTADVMKEYGIEGERYLQLVARAADVGAARNLSLAETMNIVEAAMMGNARAAKELGVALKDGYMKTEALGGAFKDVWDQLTDVEKAGIRALEFLKQSEKQLGAAADATNTFAGALKALKNAVEEDAEPALLSLIQLTTATVKGIGTVYRWIDDSLNLGKKWQAYKKDYDALVKSLGGEGATGPAKPQFEGALAASLTRRDRMEQASLDQQRQLEDAKKRIAQEGAAKRLEEEEKLSEEIWVMYRRDKDRLEKQAIATWAKEGEIAHNVLAAEMGYTDEYVQHRFDAEERLARATKQSNEALQRATDSMYKDLGKSADDWFQYQKLLLDERKRNYLAAGADQILVDKWYYAELERLANEWARQHGEILDTVKAAWKDFSDNSLNASKTMYDTWTAALTEIKSTLSDTFYQAFKGKFDSIGDLWKNLMDRMRDLFLRMVADIMAQKIMIEVGATFAGAPMGGTGGGGMMNLLAGTAGGGMSSWLGAGASAMGLGGVFGLPAALPAAAGGSTSSLALMEYAAAGGAATTGGATAGAGAASALTAAGPYALIAGGALLADQMFFGGKGLNTVLGAMGVGSGSKAKLQFGLGVGDMTWEQETPFGPIGITKEKGFKGADFQPFLDQWAGVAQTLATQLGEDAVEAVKAHLGEWRSWTMRDPSESDLQNVITAWFSEVAETVKEITGQTIDEIVAEAQRKSAALGINLARFQGGGDAGDLVRYLSGTYGLKPEDLTGEWGRAFVKWFNELPAEELATWIQDTGVSFQELSTVAELVSTALDRLATATDSVAGINLARYQETGNLANLQNYLAGKYNLQASQITPQWAQDTLSAWKAASPEELYGWTKELGVSFDSLQSDIALLAAGLESYNWNMGIADGTIQKWTASVEKATSATETRAEALTGVPGYTPQVMPSGDLARWLESVNESQKALEGFFAGLGPNQGRLESDLWDPIEDALKSASPQQTAALQLAQTMVGTKAKPYMSAALDYIIGLLKEPNANQWLNEWWQSRGGPGFQEGGTVPRTGLYMLHRGEEVTPAGGATYHITIENHGVMTTPSQTKRWLRDVITDINRERVGRRISIENTAFQGLS